MPGQFMGRGMGGLMSSGVAADYKLLPNLVAYWPLNEAAGANNALDLHTNGLTLTQVDSPGSAAGKVYAGARTFDGSADYFKRTSETLLQAGDVDFTIAAWVYLTSKSATAMAVAKSGSSDAINPKRDFQLYYLQTTDRYTWTAYRSVDSGVSVSADTFGAPPADTWTLLVAWHSAATDTAGISINNGTPNTAATGGALQAGSDAEFNIGRRVLTGGNLSWPGRIGPVAMWKSVAGGGGVLSAAQRTALYNAGNGLSYAAFTA